MVGWQLVARGSFNFVIVGIHLSQTSTLLGGSVVKRWTHQHHVDERWTWRACHAGCSVIANGVELLEQLLSGQDC